jgi:hypothetical protein
MECGKAGATSYVWCSHTPQRKKQPDMENITYALAIIVMAAVAVVLVRGLFHMMRGGDGVTSNKLMQMRILLQFIAIVLIVVTLLLTNGGR